MILHLLLQERQTHDRGSDCWFMNRLAVLTVIPNTISWMNISITTLDQATIPVT